MFSSHDVLSNPVRSPSIPVIKYSPFHSLSLPLIPSITFFLFHFLSYPLITSLSSHSSFLFRRDVVRLFLFPDQKNTSANFFFLVFPFLHNCFLDFLSAMFHSFLLDSCLPHSISVPFISLVSCTQPAGFSISLLPVYPFSISPSLPFVFEFPYHLFSLGILFKMWSSPNSSSRFIFRLPCFYFIFLLIWVSCTSVSFQASCFSGYPSETSCIFLGLRPLALSCRWDSAPLD